MLLKTKRPIRLTVEDIFQCEDPASGGTGYQVRLAGRTNATIAAFQWLDTSPGTKRMQVRALPAIPKPCSLKGKAAENANAAECMDDAVTANRFDG